MGIDWTEYDFRDQFTFTEAACLWYGVEPSESPAIKIQGFAKELEAWQTRNYKLAPPVCSVTAPTPGLISRAELKQYAEKRASSTHEPIITPLLSPKHRTDEHLDKREKSSFLAIIGALLNQVGVDPSDSTAAGKIERWVQESGYGSVGAKTIRGKLHIVAALKSKGK